MAPPSFPVALPLTFAHPNRCIRTVDRGAVKRIFARGPNLVGYQVCCPACGFQGSYLHDEAGFAEGPWVVDHGAPAQGQEPRPFQRVATLEMARAVTCFGCRGMLRIIAGEVRVDAPFRP